MSNFWKFPPHVKYDEIIEGRHDHLFHGAARDSETGIEKIGRYEYILYGDEEALLFRPKQLIYRISVELLYAFLRCRQ